MLQLTQSDFHREVERNAVLVVEFSRGQRASARELAEAFPDVAFAAVDSRREPEIAELFGLASAHALLIFRDGVVLYLEEREHSDAQVSELIGRIRALDMGKVKAEIEAERAKTALHMRRMCPTARRGPFDQ